MASKPKELRTRFMAALLIGLLGAAIALGAWSFGLLRSFEAASYDLRVRLLAAPAATTDDIRIILLDQNSLDWAQEEFGLGWPWPRQVYAPLIDFCRRAGAHSLAFDVVYTEPSVYGVADDAVMAESMKRYGSTVLPIDLRLTDGTDDIWPETIPRTDVTVHGLDSWTGRTAVDTNLATFPIPDLAVHAAQLGNVTNAPEEDTIYRRLAPLLQFNELSIPSLPLAAFLAAHPETILTVDQDGLHLGARTIPLDHEGRALLNFRGGTDAFTPISAAAVIQSELRLVEGGTPVIDPADFAGKHVFFGFSATGLLDLRPTPLGGVTPGVILNATALDNLLSNDFMRHSPLWSTVMLTLLLTLATGLAHAFTRRAMSTALVAALGVTVPITLSLVAYGQGWWMPLTVQLLGASLAIGGTGLFKYATEGRQRRFIKSAFKHYLSPEVIEQLMDDPSRLKLGGERREISIFFSDIQGFTTISESMEPEELTAVLNDFLTAMTDIIQEEGGTVDKYEGDAIIAFWNAPVKHADHASRAVRAALRCQQQLAAMRPALKKRTGHDFHMRVGLNTGPAVVGNLGSHSRFDYTMLGDAVNLAARLEGANKQFGTYTMLSQNTLDALNDPDGVLFPRRELARLQVVGKQIPVTVHEPMFPEDAPARAGRDARFAQGLAAFYAGDFTSAHNKFASIESDDPAAASYVRRCSAMQDLQGQPDEWNGVWTLTSK